MFAINANKNDVLNAQKEIEDLGYTVTFEATNRDKPNQIQQMYVYKNGKVIAKVSLMLACRVNTMFNGVGRDERELFRILGKLSINI